MITTLLLAAMLTTQNGVAEFVPGVDITPHHFEVDDLILLPVVEARKCYRELGETQECQRRCWARGEQVLSCTVRTIGGYMTEDCRCGNTSLYTRNEPFSE